MGYNVVELKLGQLLAPEEIFSKLKKDTLFFLLCADDPFFGAQFPVDEILSGLMERKILSLVISYQSKPADQNFYAPKEFEARSFVVKDGLAGLFFGSKIKREPSPWGEICLDDQDEEDILDWQRANSSQDLTEQQTKIEDFESNLPAGCQAIFPGVFSQLWPLSRMSRHYDRSCLFFEGLDATAIIELLLEQCGSNSSLKTLLLKGLGTTSLNWWNSYEFLTWYKMVGWSEALVQGSLQISHRLISKEFSEKLWKASAEIRQLQG